MLDGDSTTGLWAGESGPTLALLDTTPREILQLSTPRGELTIEHEKREFRIKRSPCQEIPRLPTTAKIDYIPQMRRAITLFLSLAAATSGLFAQDTVGDPYFYADVSAPPFDASKFVLDDEILTVLRNGTAILSRNIVIPNRLRAQMLAVALSIDPEHRLAYTTNLTLKQRQRPQPVEVTDPDTKEPIDINLIAEDLMEATYALYGNTDHTSNKDALVLVAMLYDVCHSLFPTNTELTYSRDIFLKSNKPAPWESILKLSPEPAAAGGLIAAPSVIPPPTMRPSGVKGLTLAKKQSGVNGLLIMEVDGGGMAGMASRMSATHLENVSDANAGRRLRFNQEVGQMMGETLPEIASFMEVRHGDWIKDGVIEFAFREKFVMKDGDSAGVACGLMIEGLVTGKELDPKFTCTGSLNSDGSVQPIGGVVAKLRGARKAGCEIVSLPYANRFALSDITILGEAAVLAKMQVFIVEKFDEAWALAQAEREPEIQASIDEFAKLQDQFASAGVMQTIRSRAGQASLQRILDRTPNHASARLMLNVALGAMPNELSLNGSMEELFGKFMYLTTIIEAPPRLSPTGTSDLDDFENTVAALKKVGSRVEPRTRAFATALLQFAEAMEAQKRAGRVSPDSQLRRQSIVAFQALGVELERIRKDPELLEDLEQ